MDQLAVGMSLLTQGADQFTGTATYVRELLLELGRHGGSVRVEALCNEYAMTAFAQCASPTVTLTRVRRYRAGASGVWRAAAIVGAFVGSRRLACQFTDEPRVVHYPLTLGVPRVRTSTVLSLHDVQHHDLPQHFSHAARAWRRMFYDGPARRATLVHTLSRYSKSRIVERLDIDPDRVVVIPLAVDSHRFRPEPDDRDEEVLAGFALPQRFLFYPATLWPHKNHLKLIDALAVVADDNLHLVLCGAGYGRIAEVMAYAERRGLADRVRHLGFLPDDALPAVYRRAVALVFPSTYEGFGAPILEAMATGCPVASAMAGPLAEVCGDAAVELLPDDPVQMAKAIDSIVGDQELRLSLRPAGIARSLQFSWTKVAEAHVEAYRRAGRELVQPWQS